MGRSLAWLVIDTADAAAVARDLDVKITGKRGAIPDYRMMLCALAGGRLLVVSKNIDEPLFTGKRLAVLSRRGELCAASMEEHVMFSSCARWSAGRKKWSISHNLEKGSRHLAVIGKVPKDFDALKRAALAAHDSESEAKPDGGEDEKVDHLFDLPIAYARVQTGVDVEDDFGIAPDEFQELDIGFWKRAWHATVLWRWLLGFFGGLFGSLYILGWITRKLGWQ
jgi:hypothetical protein